MAQRRDHSKVPSDIDLRSQLERVQKRIDHEMDEAIAGGNSSRPTSFSKFLGKRGTRTSMPVFAGSSTHNNVVGNNSSKDVSFVMGLSENLLLECRRLQADNEKKSIKIKSIQQEFEELQSKFEKLLAKQHNTQQDCLLLKDTNWELETKLQNMAQQLKELNSTSESSQQELKKQIGAHQALLNTFEETNLEKNVLEEEVQKMRHQHASDIADLRQNVAGLNEENDELQQKLDDMTFKVNQLTAQLTELTKNAGLQEVSSDSSVTKKQSIQPSIDPSGSAGLTQTTLRHNNPSKEDMDSALLLIDKLKQQIVQLKRARHVADPLTKDDNHSGTSFPGDSETKKVVGLDNTLERSPTNPSTKRRPQEIQAPEWSFEDSSCSIYTERSEIPNYNSDAGSEHETSESRNVRNPILQDLFDPIDKKTSLNHSTIEQYAKQHNMILLSQDEYIQEDGEMRQPQKYLRSGELDRFSEENAIKELKERGYDIHTQEEHERIQKILQSWAEPPLSLLENKAAHYGSVLISKAEYEALRSPTIESLINQLDAANHSYLNDQSLEKLTKVIQRSNKTDVHERSPELSLDAIILQAKSKGFEVVEASEWESKKNIINEPSLSYLTDAAQTLDHIIISKKNYELLLHPPIDGLRQMAAMHDHTLVTNGDYEQMTNMDREHIQEEAFKLKLAIVSQSDLDNLQNPSKEAIKAKAQKWGLELISAQELHTLSNPSMENIIFQARERNFELIEASQLKDMRQQLCSPDESFIRAKALDLNLTLLSNNSFEQLKADANSPRLEVIKKTIASRYNDAILTWLSKELHLTILKDADYRTLVENSRNPSMDLLTELAAKRGLVTVKSEELADLKRISESPSLDFLRERSGVYDSTVVDNQELNGIKSSLEHPKIEYLAHHASTNGFVLISSSDLESLRASIDNPTPEYLNKKSKKLDCLLIAKADHLDLIAKLESPDLAFLEEKLSAMGYTSVEKETYGQLQSQIETPELSFLEEKLSAMGYTSVEKETYGQLQSQIETPELSFLEEKLSAMGYTSVEKETYGQLQSQIETPELSFLEEKLSAMGYTAVEKETYGQLQSQIKTPELPSLENMVKDVGTLITSDENGEVQEKHELSKKFQQGHLQGSTVNEKSLCDESILRHPEIARIEEESHAPTAMIDDIRPNITPAYRCSMDKDELHQVGDNLAWDTSTPCNQYEPKKIESNAKSMNSVSNNIPLPSVERWLDETMSDQPTSEANEKVSLAALEQRAKKMNFAILGIEELENLRSKARYPPKWVLDEHLKEEGLISITTEEYANLIQKSENPDSSILREKLEEDGMMILKKGEYEALLSHFEAPQLSFLTSNLERLGFASIAEKDLTLMNKMLKEPSISYLEEKAKDLAYVVVPSQIYSTLRATFDAPELSFLRQKSKEHGFALISEERLHLLTMMVESPDLSYLREKAQGYEIITSERHSSLVSLESSPTLDFLTRKSDLLGYSLLSKSQVNELTRRAEDPTVQELEICAKGRGCVVVSERDFTELNKKINEPSIDYITEKSVVLGLEVLSADEYTALLAACTLESALKVIEDTGSKVLTQSDYTELCARDLEHATLEKLSERLYDMGRISVSLEEYDLLSLPLLDRLDGDSVQAFCKKNDLVTIELRELDLLRANVSQLSLEELDSLAAQHHRRLIPVHEYEGLLKEISKPSLATIQREIEGHHLVLVNETTYQGMLRALEVPTLDRLREQAKHLDYVLLNETDYLHLADEAKKSTMAKNHMISEDTILDASGNTPRSHVEEISRLKAEIEKPSEEYLSCKADRSGFILLDKQEFESHKVARNSVKNPSIEFVSNLAAEIGGIFLSKSDYDGMKAELESPSEDFIRVKAQNRGFVIIKEQKYNDEFNSWSSPSIDYLTEKAEQLNLKLVSVPAYEKFQLLCESPPVDCLMSMVQQYPEYIMMKRNEHESLVIRAAASDKTIFELGSDEPKEGDSNDLPIQNDIEAMGEEEKTSIDKEKTLETVKALNCVTLGLAEYKHLLNNQKNSPITKTQVYSAAKEFHLTVLTTEEYVPLLKSQNIYSLVAQDQARGVCHASEAHDSASIYSSRNSISVPSTLDGESDFVSRSLTGDSVYFDALTLEGRDSLVNESSSNFDTDSACYTDAQDVERISRTSTIEIKDSHHESLSITELRERARAYGYEIVRHNFAPSKEGGQAHGSFGNSLKQGEVQKGNSSPLNDTDGSSMSSRVVDSEEHIQTNKATRQGLVVITENELAQFEALKKLEKIASINKPGDGVSNISNISAVKNPLVSANVFSNTNLSTKSDFDEGSREAVNVQPDLKTYESSQRGTGERKKSVELKMNSELMKLESDEQSVVGFSSVGGAISFSPAKTMSPYLNSSDSGEARHDQKAELIQRLHKFGLVALEAEQFARIKAELAASGSNNLTVDDIMIKATEFDLVPIPRSQFEKIKEELSKPSLTKDQILQNANDFGLVVVEKSEYDRLGCSRCLGQGGELLSSAFEESEFSEDNDDTTHMISLARKLGMMCIPESAFVATTNARAVDTHNVVVLPSSYYEHILAKEQEVLKMATNEELQVEAKNRGLIFGSREPHLGAVMSPQHSKLSRQSSIHTNFSSDSNSRRSFAEAAVNAAHSDHEVATIKGSNHRLSISSSKQPTLNMDAGMSHVRHASFDGGISLATVASLSEPSIIPALTQTVIGEYIYKYYRRLGPLSTFMSRHERYFWVHPYTMTLYWSTNNPVLENPATNKTRAAAILGVEAVDDPNPYPVGLYHKSIVVKTESRSIKITCASRQRHNIWFNSLRYLVQRNMDGINLDDGMADPTDPANANKIYQLPGETSRLTNQRLSSTRRGTSTVFVNHSRAPSSRYNK
ncbi:LADA_0G06392g1_1 [Lachancea dasiensis]|uniref:LADA_0G06392g1_1 n=1 Tax=Lachancea dasiensis TaxID=1072105 RepID=A0A1G4JT57_9SACH|nr:LADA_0G06392g1_1 [Lachancea dasiensis]